MHRLQAGQRGAVCLDKVVSKVNMPGQAVTSTHIKSAAPDDTICIAQTYQIIVADAADAVSVNFFGRCKFLQI